MTLTKDRIRPFLGATPKHRLAVVGVLVLALLAATTASAAAQTAPANGRNLVSYWYYQTSSLSRACAAPDSAANGAYLHQVKCSTASKQYYSGPGLQGHGPIYSLISAPLPCLDTEHGYAGAGVRVVIGRCTGSETQQWTSLGIAPGTSGTYVFRNDGVSNMMHTPYCLTAYVKADYGDYLFPCANAPDPDYGGRNLIVPNQEFDPYDVTQH